MGKSKQSLLPVEDVRVKKAKKRHTEFDSSEVETPKKKSKWKTKSKTKPTTPAEKDEISLQLEEERKQALEILNSVLGCNSAGDGVRGEVTPPVSEDKHTNPHTELKESDEKGKDVTTNSYSVNTDLKMLFCSTAEDRKHKFSFLGAEQEESGNSSGENDDSKTSQTTLAVMDTPQAVITRLSRSEDSKDTKKSTSNPLKYFFFHSNNEALRNRLYEENSFYRTKSLEELEWEWPERRTAMKEGFRRRRKDAVKLARKKRKYFPSGTPTLSSDTKKILAK